MIGLGLLVVVVIVVGMLAMKEHSGAELELTPKRATKSARSGDGMDSGLSAPLPRSLEEQLDRWTKAGLISSDQRAAIAAEEAEAAGVAAASAPRVPMVAEALGYLGGALVVAALALVIGRRWGDMNKGAHVAVLATAAAAVFAGGFAVRRAAEPALGRLGSLLWFLSSAGVGGTLAAVMVDFVEPEGHTEVVRSALFVAVGVVAWSASLWWLRRFPLQQLATFVGIVGVVMSVIRLRESNGPPAFGAAGWVIGALWLALAWRGLAQPAIVGYALGCVAVLYSPVGIAQEAPGAAVLLGLATAGALTLIAVVARRPVLLLAGAVGLFAYVPASALYYFGDALGTDVTLFLVGVLLLGVAALVARLRQEVIR